MRGTISGVVIVGLLVGVSLVVTDSFAVQTGRIIRGPYLQPAGPNEAMVVWYTDEPAETFLQYRQEIGSWIDVRVPGEPSTHHVATFGLTEGDRYSYRLVSKGFLLANLTSRAEFTFEAAPQSTAKFFVFGDFGTGSANQRAVARAMALENPLPQFALLTGDLIYPNGEREWYDSRYFEIYDQFIQRMPFYAVIGNHDYYTKDGEAYFEFFNLPLNGPAGLTPESVYHFERAGAFFAALDSNFDRPNPGASRLRSLMEPWLVERTRASSARFRIAALHHSPFSSARNSTAAPTPAVRNWVGPLLDRNGYDVVLAGHDHIYERAVVNGIRYITTGAAGHELYPRTANNEYSRVFYGGGNGRHSFSVAEIAGRIFTLRQYDVARCLVDTLAIDKALAEGDTWHVLRGTSPPPADWFRTEFPDGSWPEVRSAFGYGNVDLGATLEPVATVYARASFNLATPADVDSLLLKTRYDDGIVVYLNGREVARRNVPEGQTYRTPASARHSGEWYETINLTGEESALRGGTNVLAVEVHSASLTNDTALVFDGHVSLISERPGTCP